MSYFFTADTHFDHTNILTYCKRPFADVEEMNRVLIANWNSVVHRGDMVYHVGDFAFGKRPLWFRNQLHGNIIFVRGNHDDLLFDDMRDRYGVSAPVHNYLEIRVSLADYTKQSIVLFHYGLRTWRHDIRGSWHLYGHSHGGLPPLGKSCDIGVDAWNYRPVSLEELTRFMNVRAIHQAPQFENFEMTKEDVRP